MTDNEIRRANQRLARLQTSGYGQTHQVRQIYLAMVRGNSQIVVNKKGQFQFKRTSNLNEETISLINRVNKNEQFTRKGIRKLLGKEFNTIVNGQVVQGLTPEQARARIFATFDNINNQFTYEDVMTLLDDIDDIDDDLDRERRVRKVENFLNNKENLEKYKYADKLKKALDKHLEVNTLDYEEADALEDLYKGLGNNPRKKTYR